MEANYRPLLKDLPKDSIVLDLGCGSGIFLAWLKNNGHIIPIGVDKSESMVEFLKTKLGDIEVICADALDYVKDFSNYFAAIFCIDLLEHLPSLDYCFELLIHCREALKEGGFIFCRVPNAANLFASYSRYMDLTHKRIFTRSSILQLLETAGFNECNIIPIRAIHLSGKIRLSIEYYIHKLLYLICGRGMEYIFTSNVCAIGYK